MHLHSASSGSSSSSKGGKQHEWTCHAARAWEAQGQPGGRGSSRGSRRHWHGNNGRHAKKRPAAPDDPEGGGRQGGGGGGQLSAALPPKVEGGDCGGMARGSGDCEVGGRQAATFRLLFIVAVLSRKDATRPSDRQRQAGYYSGWCGAWARSLASSGNRQGRAAGRGSRQHYSLGPHTLRQPKKTAMKATLTALSRRVAPHPALSSSQRVYMKGVLSSHSRKAAPAGRQGGGQAGGRQHGGSSR